MDENHKHYIVKFQMSIITPSTDGRRLNFKNRGQRFNHKVFLRIMFKLRKHL